MRRSFLRSVIETNVVANNRFRIVIYRLRLDMQNTNVTRNSTPPRHSCKPNGVTLAYCNFWRFLVGFLVCASTRVDEPTIIADGRTGLWLPTRARDKKHLCKGSPESWEDGHDPTVLRPVTLSVRSDPHIGACL